MKDLDFDHKLELSQSTHAAFTAQIEADTAWLRSLHIMDYSLLVMLHFPTRDAPPPMLQDALAESVPSLPRSEDGGQYNGEGDVSAGSRPTRKSAPPGALSPGDAASAAHGTAVETALPSSLPCSFAASVDLPSTLAEAQLPTAFCRPSSAADVNGAGVHVGVLGAFASSSREGLRQGRPQSARTGDDGAANAISVALAVQEESGESRFNVPQEVTDDGEAGDGELEIDKLALPRIAEADLVATYQSMCSTSVGGACMARELHASLSARLVGSGEQVRLFMGIIDILQIYGTRKKLEHQYKSMRYHNERDGISVTGTAISHTMCRPHACNTYLSHEKQLCVFRPVKLRGTARQLCSLQIYAYWQGQHRRERRHARIFCHRQHRHRQRWQCALRPPFAGRGHSW